MPRGKDTKEWKLEVTHPDGRVERKSFYGRTRADAESSRDEKWGRGGVSGAVPLAPLFPEGSFGWWLVVKWSPLKAHLKPRSRSRLHEAVNLVLPVLGRTPIRQVDATALAAAMKEISQTIVRPGTSAEGPIAPSTVNKCRSLIIEVVALAAESKAAETINSRRVKALPVKAKTIVAYTPAQIGRLIEASEGSIAHIPVILMAGLGLTINEARAVHAEDLVYEEGGWILRAFHIMDAHDERSAAGDMKTEDRPRELPLPDSLAAILRGAARSGPVCRNTLGRRVAQARLSRALEPAERRAGLHRLPPHDLRHCFATWFDDERCPRGVRLALMGQSRRAVEDRYVHTTHKREWIERYWSAITAPTPGAPPVPRRNAPILRKERKAQIGEINGRSALTTAQVREIKAMFPKQPKNLPIARIYGVDAKAIAKIRNGLTWRHVEAPPEENREKVETGP